MDVDVVLIGVDGLDVECRVFFAGLKETGFELCFDIVFEPFVAIFGIPDNVVLEFVRAVIEMHGSHATSLPQNCKSMAVLCPGLIHPRTAATKNKRSCILHGRLSGVFFKVRKNSPEIGCFFNLILIFNLASSV